MSVGTAGGRAGARVVDVRHQRVGRSTDHRLEVDAGVGQRGDGQRPLPAEPGRQSGAGEPGHCGQVGGPGTFYYFSLDRAKTSRNHKAALMPPLHRLPPAFTNSSF